MDIPPNGVRHAVNEASGPAQNGSTHGASAMFWNMVVRVSNAIGQIYQKITGNTPSDTSIHERNLDWSDEEFQRLEFGDEDPVPRPGVKRQIFELNEKETRGEALSPMERERLNNLLDAQKRFNERLNQLNLL